MILRAFFFDMDGVLFDSMPNHARAWENVAMRHSLDFTARDCYINEGRTGQDVIAEALRKSGRTNVTEEEIWTIYREKTEEFHRLGGAPAMTGMKEVLNEIRVTDTPSCQSQIWVVTGSGQKTLFDKLNEVYPGIFMRERMITAYDVTHGKPAPEPYLKAWQRSGLPKEQCFVIENAPLGVRAGKAAGLFTIAVNTGPLTRQDLYNEGADMVLDDMGQLLTFIRLHSYVETQILPLYDTFDSAHNRQHALAVIQESLNLVRELTLRQSPLNNRDLSAPLSAASPLISYAIAALHDVGLQTDREHHHLHSGTFVRRDAFLKTLFPADEIELMAQAVEDHRASRPEPPRSIYGRIVAEADRMLEPMTVIRRTVQFGCRHYPELSEEEHIKRAIAHLNEKYGEKGYLRLWLDTARNRQLLAQLRSMMTDTRQLQTLLLRMLKEEKTAQ